MNAKEKLKNDDKKKVINVTFETVSSFNPELKTPNSFHWNP